MEGTDEIEPIKPIAEQPAEEPLPATQVEEPQAPPPTPKKKLSKDRLEKLAKARARASEVAKQKRERKAEPFEPVVVVEQDESDEDTFEADSPGIIFVRRKRAKKPEPPANLMSPEQAMLYASFFGGSRSF